MSPFQNRKLLLLALAHFITDFFSGAIPILLAAQTAPLSLSPGQIGLIALTYRLATSLAQPLFGLLADGVRAPLLALGGVVWQATFIALAGLSGRFEVLLVLTSVAGLGSAAFHPPGAAGVPRVSTMEQRGSAMSVFLLGGTSGYALGPLVAGYTLGNFGPQGTLMLALVVVAAGPVLYAGLRRLRYGAERTETRAGEPAAPAGRRIVSGGMVVGIALLAVLIWLRSWASDSISTYLPQVLVQRQTGLVYAGNISFVMALGAAAGSLTAGFLSDRVGRHRVIVVTLLAAAPMLFGVLHTQGALLPLFAFGLGFCINATLPLTLLLGQEIAPDRPGVMSGLTLGFTFIAGGVGTAVVGALAERTGLLAALTWLPLLPLVSGVAGIGLALVQRGSRAPASSRQQA